MAKILDGKKLNAELAIKLARKIKLLKVKPKLVIIQVGDLPSSNTYIKRKKLFAEKIGALAEHKKLNSRTSEKKLINTIYKYNNDRSVHGIIVQLPLPRHIDVKNIVESIDYKKDVDGFRGNFIPATTLGILTLLEKYRVNVSGKRVVVIGRSNLVGKPTAIALLNRNATVTMCHSKTKDLSKETRRAEILVVAAGLPKLISSKHVSKGQVVVDVGINTLTNKKIVGDVDFAKVHKIVKAISPVPGGVGPMTIVSLFQNLLQAYELQRKF